MLRCSFSSFTFSTYAILHTALCYFHALAITLSISCILVVVFVFLFACFIQQRNHSTKLLSQFFFFSFMNYFRRTSLFYMFMSAYISRFLNILPMLHSINRIREVVFAFDNYFWPYFMSPTPLHFMNVSVKLSSIQ